MDLHFRMPCCETLEIVAVSSEDVGSSCLHGLSHDEGIHGL